MTAFLVYLFCLIVGFVFVAGSALLGHLGGGHAHVDGSGGHAEAGADSSDSPGVSLFSPIIMAAFVAAFGAFGLVFNQFSATNHPAVSAGLSVICAMGVAGALVSFLRKLVRLSDSSSESQVATLIGHGATVITPIPTGGVGEIAYVQAGTRYTAPAREDTGTQVGSGSEVTITRIVWLPILRCVEASDSESTNQNIMNPNIVFAAILTGPIVIVAGVVLGIVVLFVFIAVLSRYTKVGPNQVLVASGMKHKFVDLDGTTRVRGFRIKKGGGTFVVPILEKVDILSLELMTIDVQTPEVYTSKGVPVRVDGVAQIKIKGDDISISTAAEQFLSKPTDEIKNVAMQTLEGHLRAILGTMTVEEIYQNRDAFASKVQEVAATDMQNMGLGIVSFTIRDIRDAQGYLEALGKPRIAQVKRDAQIAQAEADRDAMIKSSQATQAGQEAKFVADTKIAEAQRDYQSNVAQYQAAVNQKKAEADLAYDLQKYKTGQLVKAEEVQVQIIEKQKQIELQQQEIMRRQRELEATVQRPADAERYKVETLANAKKFQLETEAAGAAAASKAQGFANADVNKAAGLAQAEADKAKGLAQAAIIEAQGKANAEATRLKAEAFQKYNQAAVIELLVKVLPEIAGKIAEPLSKTEKIVIINSGNGPGGGASKLTGDVTQIIAQLPPVLESLTGVKFEKLLEQVPALKRAMGKGDDEKS